MLLAQKIRHVWLWCNAVIVSYVSRVSNGCHRCGLASTVGLPSGTGLIVRCVASLNTVHCTYRVLECALVARNKTVMWRDCAVTVAYVKIALIRV